MGSDVSVVLHADAPVPEAVIATQYSIHDPAQLNSSDAPSAAAAADTSPSRTTHTIVERCPVIRVLEASAAKKLAGDSSAASMTSTADLHPLDQPILLIRNCAELDAFTKSRTYVPVLRALHAYLHQHDTHRPASFTTNSSGSAPSRPVCPIGLVFDRSLALGGRLELTDARTACAQYLKLFFVHLIAAVEFVREPDDAAHTKWPSSPLMLASRDASAGATSASLPPRLSVLYLDLRASAMGDVAAKWLAAGVVLRAVRRARPFMLVSARGNAAGVATTAAGGGGDTFMNYYSPDVKADMVWASLQHVLLTENEGLSPDGAKAVVEELLATDATRDVLLRQQGFDPKVQRAKEVAQALMSGRLHPRAGSHLLPQLYLVDLDCNHHDVKEKEQAPSVESKSVASGAEQRQATNPTLADPLEKSSAAASTVPSSAPVRREERVMAAGSIPPSPQNEPPQPTARDGTSVPPLAPLGTTKADVAQAPKHGLSKPNQRAHGNKQPQSAVLQRDTPGAAAQPPQHTQHIKKPPQSLPLKSSALSVTPEGTDAAGAPNSLPSPPHPPPQQRVEKVPKPAPWVADPPPFHSPDTGFRSSPRSSTPRAETAADSPALPQLQRPTTPPATPPRSAMTATANAQASSPSPMRRVPEPTHTPAELPTTAPSPSHPSASSSPAAQKGRKAQRTSAPPGTHNVSPAAASPTTPPKRSASATRRATPPSSRGKNPRRAAPAKENKQQQQEQHEQQPAQKHSPAAHVVGRAGTTTATAAAAKHPTAYQRGESGQGFVKLPGEVSVATGRDTPLAVAPSDSRDGTAEAVEPTSAPFPARDDDGSVCDDGNVTSPPPEPLLQQQQLERTATQQPKRTASARKARKPDTQAEEAEAADAHHEQAKQQQQHRHRDSASSAQARSATTTTPPRLTQNHRKGLNGREVSPQIPLRKLQDRDPSPSKSRRMQQAVATAAVLDDMPDAVVRGHSARRPREQSPQPNVRCYTPTPPASPRLVETADQSLPWPTRHQYFHSPVRPDSLELDKAHALLQALRSKERAAADPPQVPSRVSRGGRASAPPLVVSPRGRRLPEADPEATEEAGESRSDADINPPHASSHAPQPQNREEDDEPWLDHAHPIEHSSHYESAPAQPLHRVRSTVGVGAATPRSARRRALDIPALDPPEPQFATAAAKVTPAVWEEGVRKRHKSPAQVAAQRALTPGGSARSRRLSSTAYDGVQPRTDSPRQRDNVAAARAAYEAATVAEARAKAQQQLHRQQRAPASTSARPQHDRLRPQQLSASLHVEGEVLSEHDEPPTELRTPRTAHAFGSGGGGGGGLDSSPSPAPYRPQGVGTPPDLGTPIPSSKNNALQSSPAPRPVNAKRRLSTTEPPHIAPRLTTTSQLRKLTSQRARRVSEVEQEVGDYYAHTATPRRDFRGSTALAAMAQRRPTREELAAVQVEQQVEKERRQSVGNTTTRRHSDVRRGSAAAMYGPGRGCEQHDVSNPALQAQTKRQGSARGPQRTTTPLAASAAKTRTQTPPPPPSSQPQWTPAYQHGRRSANDRAGAGDEGYDTNEDEAYASSAPSLSPWGTADYQGSPQRCEEGGRVSSGAATPGEVNEYGVELVHAALRTQRKTHY